MIKKQQKWIAFFVALTFIWLMQVSTMPLAAAGVSEQASVASAGQGPDYYEAVGQKTAPAKKKSVLPWILIGVGVLGVTAAVLLLFVINDKYDPVGAWTGTGNKTTGSHWTLKMVFSGEKKSGTVVYNDPSVYNGPGTYTKDKKNITIRITSGGYTYIFTGTFTTKDKMNGTWTTENLASNNGTWEITRDGSTAQQPVIQNFAGGIGIAANK